MKITDILSPDMVIADLKGTTKPDVLNELAKALAAKYKEIKLTDLTAVLAERERLGSTAIGDGIAIPHGKLRGVTKIIGAFGRHAAGRRFRFARRRARRNCFSCWSRRKIPPACISRPSRASRVCSRKDLSASRLLAAKDGDELYSLIKEEDNKY